MLQTGYQNSHVLTSRRATGRQGHRVRHRAHGVHLLTMESVLEGVLLLNEDIYRFGPPGSSV
ncbi:MAG: hypothetical protein CME15_10775 [Gemmatimonadetes bacterium]|nr:hypothetical protein [Gemmatimonadota bacterium]